MINNKKMRAKLAKNSHIYFFNFYLSHYIKHPIASFQKEIFDITENEDIERAIICAFRDSAKSTLISTSYALWSTLGKQQKKFVLILSLTQNQAQTHLSNIKRELESNELLRNDFEVKSELSSEWSVSSLVIPQLKARITAASIDQGIRGIRHLDTRPQLIICDDVEDLSSVRTREGREKIYELFVSEVVPMGDRGTRLFVVGNLLHEDSLIMRLKDLIDPENPKTVYKEYPILDHNNKPLWPGKYPTMKDIEEVKKSTGDERAWQREYMLKIVPQESQVVHPEWIQYYDTVPHMDKKENEYRYSLASIDLAISEKTTADYTAIVSAHIFGQGNDLRIYILPHPVNERIDTVKTLEEAKRVSDNLVNGRKTKLLVESVGYQASMAQQLKYNRYPVEEIPVRGDKRERLEVTTPSIQQGNVLFPRKGAETLIQQLVGFGVENHDDLADAFSMLVNYVVDKNKMQHTPLSEVRIGRRWSITAGLWDMQF